MADRRKILIVDDEVDLCLLLRDYFTRLKFEVKVAYTIDEGKMLLQSFVPDILFLDNNLSDGTGWSDAPAFAEQFPKLYIVLVSAFHPHLPQMPDSARFQVIEKPIRFADLERQFASY